MPSWSVPKGPTLDNKKKRLAMPTGDHDLDYRHFEGVLPGEVEGKGVVMIWDQGYYWPELEVEKGVRKEVFGAAEANRAASESYKAGNLKFRLYGEKLHGSFALVRTKGMGKMDAWLLIKHRDEFCIEDYDANDFDSSAQSGRSMGEIGKDHTGKGPIP